MTFRQVGQSQLRAELARLDLPVHLAPNVEKSAYNHAVSHFRKQQASVTEEHRKRFAGWQYKDERLMQEEIVSSLRTRRVEGCCSWCSFLFGARYETVDDDPPPPSADTKKDDDSRALTGSK